jgi:hypothetical protein
VGVNVGVKADRVGVEESDVDTGVDVGRSGVNVGVGAVGVDVGVGIGVTLGKPINSRLI